MVSRVGHGPLPAGAANCRRLSIDAARRSNRQFARKGQWHGQLALRGKLHPIRPVAVSIMTFILALTGKLIVKDKLTRQGPSGFAVRGEHMGVGLVGKTLFKVIGLLEAPPLDHDTLLSVTGRRERDRRFRHR